MFLALRFEFCPKSCRSVSGFIIRISTMFLITRGKKICHSVSDYITISATIKKTKTGLGVKSFRNAFEMNAFQNLYDVLLFH